MTAREYFQSYMPGDVCFGCGGSNSQGLRIKSYWDGDDALCDFIPETHHRGWPGLVSGGILATLIDCHCMATAMATAIRNENRALGTEPQLRFATVTLTVNYLKPTLAEHPLQLRAHVTDIAKRKYMLACAVYSGAEKTVDATAVGYLVYRSDRPDLTADAFRV